MDYHRVVAVDIQHANLQHRPGLRAGPISMVRSSSMVTLRMAFRIACQVSSSGTPCLRAGSAIRT
jgi:hypothetical protein